MLDWELGLGAKGRAGPTVGAGAAVAEKADARPMPAAPAPVRRARREARRRDGLRSSEAGSVMAFLSWGTLLVECCDHYPIKSITIVQPQGVGRRLLEAPARDRKSTRLNSSHVAISYAVSCSKKK